MHMLISGFSPAKEPGIRANQKISGYNHIMLILWGRHLLDSLDLGWINLRYDMAHKLQTGGICIFLCLA